MSFQNSVSLVYSKRNSIETLNSWNVPEYPQNLSCCLKPQSNQRAFVDEGNFFNIKLTEELNYGRNGTV